MNVSVLYFILPHRQLHVSALENDRAISVPDISDILQLDSRHSLFICPSLKAGKGVLFICIGKSYQTRLGICGTQERESERHPLPNVRFEQEAVVQRLTGVG